MKGTDTVTRNRHYRCLEYDKDQEGDLYLIACGMERCDGGVIYGPDLRTDYHLHVILSGKGVLSVGAKTISLTAGQMFILKDNETYTYTADNEDPWNYCWVTFGGSNAKVISEEIGFTDGKYCLDSSVSAGEFYELIGEMYEHPQMNYIDNLRRRGILFEFLSLALSATQTRERSDRYKKAYSSGEYAKRAVEFIHYNYATISVTDIAEYVGFSRSYFTSMFKKQVGISPQEYLIQHRLKKSCELMEITDLSIKEIAERVGYEDQLNFSRAFHSAFGVSPSGYRELKSL